MPLSHRLDPVLHIHRPLHRVRRYVAVVLHNNTQQQARVKVEIKNRWNYKFPWALNKIFWAPTFLAGLSKSLSISCFERVIKQQIRKENNAGRVNVTLSYFL